MPDNPTAFDLFVQAEGIPPELWATSHRVRAWVRKHCNSRYVPEQLLDQLGIEPRVTFGAGAAA